MKIKLNALLDQPELNLLSLWTKYYPSTKKKDGLFYTSYPENAANFFSQFLDIDFSKFAFGFSSEILNVSDDGVIKRSSKNIKLIIEELNNNSLILKSLEVSIIPFLKGLSSGKKVLYIYKDVEINGLLDAYLKNADLTPLFIFILILPLHDRVELQKNINTNFVLNGLLSKEDL